jgi:hypothetical protein
MYKHMLRPTARKISNYAMFDGVRPPLLMLSGMLAPQVVQRSAGERRETGAEDDAGVGQIGVGDDALVHQLPATLEQRPDEPLGETGGHRPDRAFDRPAGTYS